MQFISNGFLSLYQDKILLEEIYYDFQRLGKVYVYK